MYGPHKKNGDIPLQQPLCDRTYQQGKDFRHLKKNGGWKMILSFWVLAALAYFQVRLLLVLGEGKSFLFMASQVVNYSTGVQQLCTSTLFLLKIPRRTNKKHSGSFWLQVSEQGVLYIALSK